MEIVNAYLLFPFDSITFWNQFRMNLLFTGLSFAYWYARQNYEIEKRQQRLEKEVLDARLKALKNQINPHFLYNTLSFLYTRSLPVSEELSGTIARLSAMLRYSLDEVEEEGKVALEKEVAHLKNFIDIHQFRFNHKLQVIFETTGNISRHQIMPLLLITFVENAFKHGKLQDAAHPVQIKLCTTDKEIMFSVVNKKTAGVKEKSSGIGLQNVRNRLDLAYPQRYTLAIDDKNEEFSVHLKVMLHP
jgi:two-component system LytT family sensor kinase